MSESKHPQAFHPEPILQIRDLCVDYITDNGDFNAVKSVSFDIGKGEIFGLAGESGCGKSTIAFAINRLHKAPAFISGGQIWFKERDILRLSDEDLRVLRWSEIAMVFQSAMNSLNPVLTIEEQFSDVLRHHKGCTDAEAKERAEKLLDLVNIPRHRLSEYPHQFSGGMRQRLVIAIALSLNPDMIIMDEPTTALDVVVQREILQQIYQLREEFGFSVLFITHDLALMSQLCDRIAVMRHGELVEVNTSTEIRNNPQHPYTQKLWASFPNIHEARHKKEQGEPV
ncbi:putative ABC-type dipeptide/oligopeptide/nickel transport system, ATPase component [Vibrio nigripulchritudo MADA3029]|uniref:ABC-type dipeptide/oligopeptide/nickel transport system, ATPase component n=2 Tax=Vibrio nigripulchritudo TaxID=28173 RepID=A0AAV2VLM2_9VIBR|nr:MULTISPECIES: ABC transporter ATP-binding protein [Vibrio]KJY79669.1 sugar ABC transporter ATP-binding protein [Vibrio nigripulchritudo]UAB73262.1 ABC transporter ATP-binding protein [Vibrio sp. SCSIO 43132]CCN36618.1 putative ABC-type dipeptide/oligopeptide/nickel transport system, ATPase component [Vibrio nigripulchritudo AM115]CCN43835.1 putative ABC-type dipeptide/oligopeptide/nickel transport system, ATPase component [Vibrio nigripulchritudo FTn2]CCN50687.1 putative ABC-type dipeptide/